ncbi:glycosyltransferase [Teichococcus oryzae]|uniref:Glycosyltransferase family 4 protein n=1 Tax=Teichococcus oryzae TaxID=1608942 RepID=A0A5B2TB60_9PROT|nr:glycosyltransferase [Pseudoroseomonas oryzae]KAA2211756.1 glycosyltransferase family 4 protein [Pseudoroseomonas oryzae]
MRIDVLAQLDHPVAEPFAGGRERHTYVLVQELRRLGHRVRLFAAAGSDPALEPVCLGPATGSPERGSRRTREAAAELQFRMQRRALHIIADDPGDIIHNNTAHELPLMLAHRLPVPMLTTLHAPPAEPLHTAVLERQQRDLPFSTLSPSLMVSWRPALDHVPVIASGLPLDRFRACLRQPDAAPHAIWRGRIAPGQGLMMALQACLIAGIPLMVAGPIEDMDFWRNRVRPRLNNGSRHLGILPPGSLPVALAAAGVAICTDPAADPHGYSAIEALACGTPVAGFAQGTLPMLLDASSGRLAAPGGVAALSRCIQAALGLRRDDCRMRAEQFCTATQMARGYLDAYGQAIAHHRLPPRDGTTLRTPA